MRDEYHREDFAALETGRYSHMHMYWNNSDLVRICVCCGASDFDQRINPTPCLNGGNVLSDLYDENNLRAVSSEARGLLENLRDALDQDAPDAQLLQLIVDSYEQAVRIYSMGKLILEPGALGLLGVDVTKLLET